MVYHNPHCRFNLLWVYTDASLQIAQPASIEQLEMGGWLADSSTDVKFQGNYRPTITSLFYQLKQQGKYKNGSYPFLYL